MKPGIADRQEGQRRFTVTRFAGTVCVGLASLTVVAGSQTPRALSFDAASIKLNRSAEERTDGLDAGNRFRMTNETLWRLIGEAYASPAPLPRYRIIGGPSWID